MQITYRIRETAAGCTVIVEVNGVKKRAFTKRFRNGLMSAADSAKSWIRTHQKSYADLQAGGKIVDFAMEHE